jgi:hypothetical protein
MVSVVEQGRQNPMNATPVGWDVADVKYPGVNTCTTVTACGQKGLVGLHLGLFMGAGQEGGKGSENAAMIDNAYLDLYLHMMKQQAYVRAAGTVTRQLGNLRKEDKKLDTIYVAGALQVWAGSAPAIWSRLRSNLERFAKESGARLEYFQFDDSKVMTVDIFVNKGAVKFTKVGEAAVVTRDVTFRV